MDGMYKVRGGGLFYTGVFENVTPGFNWLPATSIAVIGLFDLLLSNINEYA